VWNGRQLVGGQRRMYRRHPPEPQMTAAWRRRRRRINFGFDFCDDDENRFCGHVSQIATPDGARPSPSTGPS
jgi:hypothetical protein